MLLNNLGALYIYNRLTAYFHSIVHIFIIGHDTGSSKPEQTFVKHSKLSCPEKIFSKVIKILTKITSFCLSYSHCNELSPGKKRNTYLVTFVSFFLAKFLQI